MGIGLTTPSAELDVRSAATAAVFGRTDSSAHNPAMIQLRGSTGPNIPTSGTQNHAEFYGSGRYWNSNFTVDGQVQTGMIRIASGASGSGRATGQNLQFFLGANDSGALSEIMRITNQGNVGIGTTSPGEKLDVIGQIKSDKLNKIVFLRAQGAPNDDGLAINNAIDALPDDGGIIYLLPGTYNIKTTVRNANKKAVKIRGFGGAAIDQHVGLTTLKWDNANTDTDKRIVKL